MAIAFWVAFIVCATWTVVSIIAIGFSRIWFREREGRIGPIPVSQAAGLTLPLRRLLDPPRETLRSFRLARGQTVLEIGPGPGYFTPDAADIAGPQGRVLCLDLQPGMLRMLQERIHHRGIINAAPIAADATRRPFRRCRVSGGGLRRDSRSAGGAERATPSAQAGRSSLVFRDDARLRLHIRRSDEGPLLCLRVPACGAQAATPRLHNDIRGAIRLIPQTSGCFSHSMDLR